MTSFKINPNLEKVSENELHASLEIYLSLHPKFDKYKTMAAQNILKYVTYEYKEKGYEVISLVDLDDRTFELLNEKRLENLIRDGYLEPTIGDDGKTYYFKKESCNDEENRI